MEYIDSMGGRWLLGRERGMWTYQHEDYDGPEDKRCGATFTKELAIEQIEDSL